MKIELSDSEKSFNLMGDFILNLAEVDVLIMNHKVEVFYYSGDEKIFLHIKTFNTTMGANFCA